MRGPRYCRGHALARHPVGAGGDDPDASQLGVTPLGDHLRMGTVSETLHLDFDGHRLAYRVTGRGPAFVVLNLYRRRADAIQAQQLGDGCQVFQIYPLGYGYSERVPGYAGEFLADQVVAVLDRHGAERFIVWGYSKGGAMAACIARGSARAAAWCAARSHCSTGPRTAA